VIHSTAAPEALKDPNSKLSLLRGHGSKLNLTRTGNRAFHPHGDQHVLMISPNVFIVLRISPEKDQHILTMTNVTNRACSVEIPIHDLNIEEERWYDLLAEKEWMAEGKKLHVHLQPYDVIWLTPSSDRRE
jgi:hypothetical protein